MVVCLRRAGAIMLGGWIAGGTYAPHTTLKALKLMTLQSAIYIS